MAIHKGREVQIQKVDNINPNTTSAVVSHPSGLSERVPLGSLQLTNDEVNQIKKDHPLTYDDLQTISDKDLKKVQDSQDPDKIQESQNKVNKT